MTRAQLVFAGLGRRKLRTGLLVLSVLIAFTVFAALASFQSALSSSLGGAEDERLMVANRLSFTENLPFAHVEDVSEVQGVAEVSYSQYVGAYFREPRNFILAFAVEPESWLRIHADLKAPAQEIDAFLQQRDSAMVGRSVAERFRWKVGDRISLSSHMWRRADGANTWPLVIRAIYDGVDPSAPTEQVFMHYGYLDSARVQGKGDIGYVHVLPATRGDTLALATRIDAVFENSRAETRTTYEQAFYAAFVEQQGSIGLMVVSVAAAGLLTSLLIVASAMMQSIRERQVEFAILKVIGFGPARIAASVLGETFAIAVAGGVGGLFVASVIIDHARSMGMFFSSMTMTMPVIILALGLMVALALITGGIPAWRAMRISAATAFRKG